MLRKHTFSNRKKVVILALILGFIVALVSLMIGRVVAGRLLVVDGHRMHALLFNTPRAIGGVRISPVPHDFWIHLTDTQLNGVFPFFDRPITAIAFYTRDGTFAELDARMPLSDTFGHEVQIKIGVDNIRYIFSDYIFLPGFQPRTSYVHGVPVEALMIRGGWGSERSFRADFVVDNIVFQVRINENSRINGQILMTEIVNKLIIGGAEWLYILSDPIIPELRFESLMFHEALQDEDFGMFVPLFVPYTFEVVHISRHVRGHINENRMSINWRSSQDYDYLYSVFVDWIESRDSDSNIWPFERIFWGEPSIRWFISTVDDFDIERVVPAENRRKYDWSLYPLTLRTGAACAWPFRDIPDSYSRIISNPVFLAEDLTSEIVKARENIRPVKRQVAYGDCSCEVFMPLTHISINFGVLFDDVLVTVEAEGLTYEYIWAMFESLSNTLQ